MCTEFLPHEYAFVAPAKPREPIGASRTPAEMKITTAPCMTPVFRRRPNSPEAGIWLLLPHYEPDGFPYPARGPILYNARPAV